MRLGQKNLAYSMTLAGVLMLFLVGYFMYMLPYLYVDYMMEQNLKSVREQHEAYVENGTYEGVQVKNSAACISVEIPYEGNYFLLTGKAFSARIAMRDERLLDILEWCREKLDAEWAKAEGGEKTAEGGGPGEEGTSGEGRDAGDGLEERLEAVKEVWQEDGSLPVEFQMLYTLDMEDGFFNESLKIHPYSDHMVVFEAGVEDGFNQYTTYMAVEQGEDGVIVSFLPVVNPQLNEIRPIVLQSLPMLGAVITLVVLLFSRLYSQGIVSPIVELVRHTERMEDPGAAPVERLSARWRRRDEVGQLADILDDFYLRIREGYQKLEEKNLELEEKNTRQEVFLRASSHQLKTPIAAALLLVDGMINEIGRYRDAKAYLPRVKEQLLSMRKMVEDILYLSRCEENLSLCRVEVAGLIKARLGLLRDSFARKGLTVCADGAGELETYTDERLFSQILDNILSNAVKYTPEGGRIEITIYGGREPGVRVENFGVTVPEDLIPHIYEPFVGGRHKGGPADVQGHGLGLYIAAYYARKLGITLTLRNGEQGGSVAVTLLFCAEDMK